MLLSCISQRCFTFHVDPVNLTDIFLPQPQLLTLYPFGTVGHCHPQVVLAGKNQMATLVTAQGFVNDLLSKYVKELTSHLPDSLNVVYLVNSG